MTESRILQSRILIFAHTGDARCNGRLISSLPLRVKMSDPSWSSTSATNELQRIAQRRRALPVAQLKHAQNSYIRTARAMINIIILPRWAFAGAVSDAHVATTEQQPKNAHDYFD